MKSRSTILVLSLSLMITLGLTAFEIMEPSGAPAAQTGSPGDGSNCTSCHGGVAQNVSGWITTDIPAEGYTPGQTYQVTCTNTLSGSGKYGFQCSPQNIAGALQGTLTAGTNNKLVGLGKYVTHSLANSTNNSWTFSWTAPAATIGSVTFYAAFARGSSGNVAKTSLTVTKASGMSVASINPLSQTTVSPNPSQGRFQVRNLTDQIESITVFSPSGSIVYQTQQVLPENGNLDIDLGSPSPGIYFMSLRMNNGEETTRKVLIR